MKRRTKEKYSKDYLKHKIREIRDGTNQADIEHFDKSSRNKVIFLNATFLTSLLTYISFPTVYTALILVVVNGTFSIPYLRVFIHSEMHWGLIKNKALSWLFRSFAFAIYHVPFEAYKYGHFAHHRHDNDVAGADKAKDKQSTYLTSRQGTPINPLLWIIHYLFVYQFYYQTKLVIDSKLRSAKINYTLQSLIILALDIAIFNISEDFFVFIYLPSIALAWIGSGIVLYMMHCVDFEKSVYHHSVNSYSTFFNKFGDNDGLHIVHSMFPSLHPMLAKDVDELIKPELHESQVLDKHYVTQFFINFVKGK